MPRRSRVRQETAAAVVFAVFMLALGVVLISRVDGYSRTSPRSCSATCSASATARSSASAIAAAAVLVLVAALYRPFLPVSFDRQRAAALGLPVDRLDLLLLVVVTIAVVIGFQIVGALLVLGLLMAPLKAAALLTKRLPAMMLTSATIAAASAPIGLLASWHLDLAAGASIVLVAVSVFVVLLAVRPAPAG